MLLALILAVFMAIPASAVSLDEYKFNMEIDEGYQILTEDNIQKSDELVSSLGHNIDSMKQYFKQNSLILFAISEDGKRQIQVTCIETELSKQLNDISLMDEGDALGFVGKFIKADNISSVSLVTIGDMKLYEAASTDKDSGGNFATVQYVTIRGGKLYTIGFFESAASISAEFKDFAQKTINTLSIKGSQSGDFSGTENIAEMIIVGLLILLAAVVLIITVVSLIRDFARYDENERPIIIRRRKK